MTRLASFFTKVGDCIVLSIFWLICCIPIFTIGSATASLYYVVHKNIKKSRGYPYKDFFKSFKDNFAQATVSWLVALITGLLFGIITLYFYSALIAGLSIGYGFFLLAVIDLIYFGYLVWLFAYVARFEGDVTNTIKLSAIMAFSHIGTTVINVILLIICLYAIYLQFPLILILPAGYILVVSVFIEKQFRKNMSKEDLELEDKKNMQ